MFSPEYLPPPHSPRVRNDRRARGQTFDLVFPNNDPVKRRIPMRSRRTFINGFIISKQCLVFRRRASVHSFTVFWSDQPCDDGETNEYRGQLRAYEAANDL